MRFSVELGFGVQAEGLAECPVCFRALCQLLKMVIIETEQQQVDKTDQCARKDYQNNYIICLISSKL